MIRSLASLVVLVALIVPVTAAEPITPTTVIKLFNGQDLTGWYTWLQDTKYEDPRKVFTVHDGLLHVSGDGLGCLTTKQDYRDYRLVAEFKWGPRTWHGRKEKTKDSGILIHSFGEDGAYNGIWMKSIEAQVIEGGCGDFIVVAGQGATPETLNVVCETAKDRDGETIWQKGGERKTVARGRVNWFGRDPDWKDVLGFRGKNDVEKPDGEWNRMEVICEGGKITNIVNGVVVNQALDCMPKSGKIQIQTELAEVFYRTFELHPLKK
ncbi:MAG: DUF1080 domain-containing protein [Planctomycetaceae bacterium]|nr:DUF1080 domain-containing protein [Planctomycetaceae bacterium]